MLQLLASSPNTNDNSPESIEKLRLDCFQAMLHSVGLRTKLTWQDTCYSLDILRPQRLWPLPLKLQTLSQEIVPSKPFAKHKWNPPIDCYTESALTSMYHGALDCALSAHQVSLGIPDSVQFAVTSFPSNLAHGLQVFPVRCEENAGQYSFWAVSAKQMTDRDYELAEFIWPGIQIHAEDDDHYCHVRTYVNFFIERYFGGVRSPYGEIIGCGCLDNLELENI